LDLYPSRRRRSVEIAALALVGLAAARGVSAYLRQLSVNKLTRRFVCEMRRDLIQRFTTMPLECHFKIGAADLFHGVTSDAANLRRFAGQVVVRSLTNVLRVVCPVVLLFLHQAFLAAVCCAVIPVQWLISSYLQKNTQRARTQARRIRSQFTTVVKEQIDGAETIQCLGACEVASNRAIHKVDQLEREELLQADCAAKRSAVIWIMTSIGFALAWVLGGLRVLEGSMSTGELVAFCGLLAFAYAPFRRFADAMGNSRKITLSLGRVQALLDLPPGPVEQPDARPLVVGEGRIELRNVSFAYNAEPVLQNARLILQPRCLTALAGASGSGKTSLLRLINRLYDPTDGQVLIDGHDVREFTVASLRSAVVLVPQRPMIFTGTIAYNLRLGRPQADDTELLQACEAADLLGLVHRLKDGLETRLGRRGIQLSGGEAQRLSIARAVLMRSKILLLDEPTSSLDIACQAAIMETLCRLKKEMTIVVAGHRLEALSLADHLVILDKGQIVEQGPPMGLLFSHGLYHSLIARVATSQMEQR
jgi:ABC-type multidrug transport system fused ATPase/permease subunit